MIFGFLLNSKSDASKDRDVSKISRALKLFYRKSYSKIDMLQPPLRTPFKTNLVNNYVQLSIVDADEVQKDFVYHTERSYYLQKLMSYRPISYYDVFENETSLILISGIAGIGKTTLLKKHLLDWSHNLILKNIDFLFYLECRRINQYQNISNINELINTFYKDILNDFNFSNYSVMLMIDGLDEFKFLDELINCSSKSNYPIVNALSEVQKFKVVTSGRISAISQYENAVRDINGKFSIQIMGFNKSGINYYIENIFI
nr:NACHT, LRR and PYD domains-containing protein 9A-like isoform X1 [Hydra vulgaris]